MNRTVDYFDEDLLRENLKQKTVRGGLFTSGAQFVQLVLQLATIPILSRLLTPADFGLVAMVAVVTGFAAMFVDAGLGMATVQRPKITPDQVSNLFWLGLALGFLIAAIISAISPVVAWIYTEPRLTAITLALCPSFVFAGMTIQHQALLMRGMRFRSLATIQIASAVIGLGLGIGWAWWLGNYWALVWIPLATSFVRMIGTWTASGWWPGLPKRGTSVRPMISFGAYLAGHRITNYLARNVDYLLIGWYWGATPLGLYERAYKILLFPMRQVTTPLSSVITPGLSRAANEPERYRRGYLTFLETTLVLTVPTAAFLFVTRDLCIPLLLGPNWDGAIPIFAWLAISAVVQPVTSTTGCLFISQGRTQEMFAWSILGAVLVISSIVAGLPWGPVYVAAVYSLSGLAIRLPIILWWVTRKGPIRITDIATCLPLPATLAASACTAVLLLRQLLPEMPMWAEFSLCCIAGSLVGLAVVLATPRGQRWHGIFSQLLSERRLEKNEA